MTSTHDLTHLDPYTFEHLVNSLAMRVLGAGYASFGPGSDGGRDGYFEGQANYPSSAESWTGRWYIQSKFHAPHLTRDAQKWLIDQVKLELDAFADPRRNRIWPDILIIATNVEPSGHPITGAFDSARSLVQAARPELANRFHIWGGRQILEWLNDYPDVARRYGHFLTPGHVITDLVEQIKDERPAVNSIVHGVVVSAFSDQQYAKLEQAGSTSDLRPGIHDIFVDLPFRSAHVSGNILNYLHRTASRNHRADTDLPASSPAWTAWRRHPARSRTWLVKGGPGQGKSTLGQYFAQIQRAALILQGDTLRVTTTVRDLAREVQRRAEEQGVWPVAPRVPIYVELKEYAQWRSRCEHHSPTGVLSFLANRLSERIEQPVLVGTLKRLLTLRSWFFAFDGLDEVPADAKDTLATEVRRFVDDVLVSLDADAIVVCTSRPQGYSGQFDALDSSATLGLLPLTPEQALKCARPVVCIGRSPQEASTAMAILSSAIQATAVQELMKTPLQAHIMAVIVRDGRHPPERKWALFSTFYDVIYRREASKEFIDQSLRRLFHKDAPLLRTVHQRVGFVLHSRAERSVGAVTSMSRDDFRALVAQTVGEIKATNLEDTIETVMAAATTRLVLLSTPDAGDQIRFDVRQLQEFFAASYLYDNVPGTMLRKRLEIIAGDAHWIEVTHFLLSALIEMGRTDDLSVAVDVLHALDSSDNEHARIFNRRLARGALAAAKLLEDGVLEQDKRIRVRFESLLMTMASSTDIDSLIALRDVPLESNFWLRNLMVRALNESSSSESIGAAVLLALMLDRKDERTPRLLEVWNVADYAAGDLLAEAAQELCDEEREVIVDGVSSMAFALDPDSLIFELMEKLLVDQNWYKRNRWAALEVLRSRDAEVWRKTAYANCTFRSKVLNLTPYPLTGELLDRGWFIARMVAFRIGCDDPSIIELAVEAPDAELGYFGFVAALAKFAIDPTRHRAVQLLRTLGGDWSTLFAAPARLLPYAPIVRNFKSLAVEEAIRRLEALDDSKFATELAAGHFLGCPLGPSMVSFDVKEPFLSREQVVQLAELNPDLAVRHWANRGGEPDISCLPTEILLDKTDAFAHMPQLWGKIIAFLGDEAGAWREQLLREVDKDIPLDVEVYYHRSDKMYPFSLVLPHEAAMLPHLCVAIAGNFLVGLRWRREMPSAQDRTDVNDARRDYATLAERYVGDIKCLVPIIESKCLRGSVRAAAIMFESLHRDGGAASLVARGPILAELSSDSAAFDVIILMSCCVEILGAVDDPRVRSVLGAMLDAGRQYWCRLKNINWFLSRWRSRSRAPTDGGPYDAWLDVSRFLGSRVESLARR